MEPTRWQRFFASGWLEFIWMAGGALIGVVISLNSTEFRPALLLEWPTNVWIGLVILLSAITGFYLAVFPGMLILLPLFIERNRINGAPFEVGDCVQIIRGKYAGRITIIYSKWQGDGVRVDLGEEAKNSLEDIFGSSQLLRVRVES